MTVESIDDVRLAKKCLFQNSISLKTIEDGKVINDLPEEVSRLERKWLLGLVKLVVITEDRKPPPGVGYKYKTQLSIKVGWVRYSFIFRTKHEPHVFKNGKKWIKKTIKGLINDKYISNIHVGFSFICILIDNFV